MQAYRQSRRVVCGATALLIAIVCLAVPADAKRARFGFGGIGGSGGGSVERVYTLPRSAELQMPDGRPVDIGRIVGGSKNGTLVGYVGSTREYLNLPQDAMDELVGHAGFANVAALQKHLDDKKQAFDAERKSAVANAIARKERMKPSAAMEPRQDSGVTDRASAGTDWLSLVSNLLSVAAVFLMIGYCLHRACRWVRPVQATVAVAAPEVVQRLEGGRRMSARVSAFETAKPVATPAVAAARVARGPQGATPAFGRR
jgi:hypothetical protein